MCAGGGDNFWNPDSAQENLGSEVKTGPGAVPVSFIKYLLSSYYVPGPVMSPGSMGESFHSTGVSSPLNNELHKWEIPGDTR